MKASVVVSAAGSLHSPALLLRSHIKCNGNVGKHLHIHPATVIYGHFPQVCCVQSITLLVVLHICFFFE